MPIGCRPSLRNVADSLAFARSLPDLADDVRVGSRPSATGPRGFPSRFDADPPPRGVRSSTTLLISGSSPEPLLRARTVARERTAIFLSWGSHPRAPRSTPGGNRPSIDHPWRFTAPKGRFFSAELPPDRLSAMAGPRASTPRDHLPGSHGLDANRDRRFPCRESLRPRAAMPSDVPVPTSWSCTTSPAFSARGRRRRRLLPILGFAAFHPW